MFDVQSVRSHFPSLQQTHDDRQVIFFDNPGGTQVPRNVVEAMTHYLLHDNANHGGAYATSRRSDTMIDDAHRAMTDMLGASSPDEIVFGANMTSLTFTLSRALGHWLKPGDDIVVTRLDHDADVSPWMLLARDTGANLRWVDFRPEDCTLDMDDLERRLSRKTKLVACVYASNAVGTINDVKTITEMAHHAGAMVFVDAVQYAPHGLIDVKALDCDFLACSAYKFFGPHEGILYGKYDLLDRLPAYKVRPAKDRPPYKFETGTQNHEGIAGTLAAVEYLTSLSGKSHENASRRDRLSLAMKAIEDYERDLVSRLIAGLKQIRGLRIYGITERSDFDRRVPTVAFRMEGISPRRVAEYLGEKGIFVWDGNYYALAVTERLGLEDKGGMVRVGLVHYNTADEVDRLLDSLERLRA
ncbi:MAG: cysteine desulfurase-like protein [Deltaproteobacteria bacterium]|nr:cysteine desulfurase-like protein [Deltaproteobacteria bacterium]